MKASTEEFLYFLLWNVEALARPTWTNLHGSFEGWAWRNRLGRRLAELERQNFLEREASSIEKPVVRLTADGRRAALGGADPLECWNRSWDGQWRLVLFDLPQYRRDLRMKLWRYFKQEGFGYLQQSVWITPDPIAQARRVFGGTDLNTEALTFFQGRPCGHETDADVVSAAWDFAHINSLYERCLVCLRHPPAEATPIRLREWGHRERQLWKTALRADPLLPNPLLPRDYLGRKAWELRREAIGALAQKAGWIS